MIDCGLDLQNSPLLSTVRPLCDGVLSTRDLEELTIRSTLSGRTLRSLSIRYAASTSVTPASHQVVFTGHRALRFGKCDSLILSGPELKQAPTSMSSRPHGRRFDSQTVASANGGRNGAKSGMFGVEKAG